jgi:hypothetical protein
MRHVLHYATPCGDDMKAVLSAERDDNRDQDTFTEGNRLRKDDGGTTKTGLSLP